MPATAAIEISIDVDGKFAALALYAQPGWSLKADGILASLRISR